MIMISVSQKGARADTVREIVEAALREKYPNASIQVVRKEPAESRGDRMDEAMGLVEDAQSIAEELKDELETWKDSLPENLQSGDKASQLEDAINSLDEFINSCEEASSNSGIEFPGMY
jgi:uncharacterized protein with von Willebrand factor type A (vWA) domain